MTQATQFAQVYRARVAALHGWRDSTRRRWRIWAHQADRGEVPCFATDLRHTCRDTGCPWRGDCLSLKAEWQR